MDRLAGFLNEAKHHVTEFFSETKEDFVGLGRAIESQPMKLIKLLRHPEGVNLTQHKEFALKKCREYIPHFTNTDAAEFFDEFHKKDAMLRYIREETGFFRKNLSKAGMFSNLKYGNTNTYKEIMGMLKERILDNYKRHSESGRRTVAQDRAEEEKIIPIMTCRRGRLPNVAAYFGFTAGHFGEFIEAYEKRPMRLGG